METSLLNAVGMLAQQAAPAAPSAGGSMMSTLVMFIPLLAIMYFLMIRPQQKKQKEQQEMLNRLKAGDKVMTQSGVFGKIIRIDDNGHIFLEVAERVQIEVLQAAIAGKVQEKEAASEQK